VIEHLRPIGTDETLVLRAVDDRHGLTLWFTVDDRARAVARVVRL